ncbi:hypothetical protein LOCC1_G007191 [Lachnellula occidentalis]|uniref:GPI anchored serine-threonine rich protein n=1 Tax=Lachnellula occidentalis TaxID=215460 RepID=A0A8H8U5R1_9HELO|nr:hypothetical protein LOCC1_G007191 [Lachnellula occidentalis]
MQFSLLPISLFLSVAAAATSTSSAAPATSSVCAAQDVLNQCLLTGQGYLDACSTTDYACLCAKSNDLLTCYFQCPNDPGRSAAQSTKTTNCNNAILYGQTSSAVSKAVSTASASASATGASVTGDSDAVKTATGTASGATSSASGKANSAGNMVIGAGSVLLGLAGVIAAVL